MQSTERLRPITWLEPGPGRSPWFVLLTMMLAATVAFDIALVTLPDFTGAVLSAWRDLSVSGPGGAWITLALRSGVAMGGAALGFGALVAFARGVASAPFVWLTPVLISFSTIVVACMPVKLPLPVSVQAYALASAFLLLGGGALLQVGRSAHVFVGTLIIAMPVGLLATSYATPSAPALVTSVKMVFFVLATCSVGVVLIAMLTPAASELFDRAQLRREHEHRLAQAMQRVRASEERVSLAEAQVEAVHHSLRVQGAELEAALSLQDEAHVLTGQRNRTLRAWLSALIVVGSLGSLLTSYFMLYQPLVRRARTSELAIDKLQATQRSELQRVRAQASLETAGLQTELVKVREQIAASALALGETQKQSDALRTQLEAQAATTAAPVKAKAKPARQQAKRAKATRAVTTRAAAKTPSKPEARSAPVDDNDPIGGLDL